MPFLNENNDDLSSVENEMIAHLDCMSSAHSGNLCVHLHSQQSFGLQLLEILLEQGEN